MARNLQTVGAYVTDRWARWLRAELALRNWTANDLAREIASNPGNIQTHPRQAVEHWLSAETVVSPKRAFDAGEVLGGIGIVALYASGHMVDFLMTLRRLALKDPSTAVALFSLLPNRLAWLDVPGSRTNTRIKGSYGDFPPELEEWLRERGRDPDKELAAERQDSSFLVREMFREAHDVIVAAFEDREAPVSRLGPLDRLLFEIASEAIECVRALCQRRNGARKLTEQELLRRADRAGEIGLLLMRDWAGHVDPQTWQKWGGPSSFLSHRLLEIGYLLAEARRLQENQSQRKSKA